MSSKCAVTGLRIIYWAGWLDDGRIDVSTDHVKSYTCAHKESAAAVLLFTDMHIQSKPDVTGLRHWNTVDLP